MTMDREAELQRILKFTAAARQRIRRLDVLLDEQVRILALDPALSVRAAPRSAKGHRFTMFEVRMFAMSCLLASLAAFLAGYWSAVFAR